jgi:Xaa-Pro dipeptidase
MSVPFSKREYAARKRSTLAEMAARNLDGLLLFRPESQNYLTGMHTFGYCFFQCIYLGADGRMSLLTRLPDVLVAKQTTILEDLRVWTNLPGANPALDLRKLLVEHGCAGKRLGIELDAYGLTAYNYRRVDAALSDLCRLEDASDLVTRLRVVKSPQEIEYCRRAGRLADAALVEANRLAVPGAFEGDILAAMQGAVFKGDGDYSGNEFIVNSGPRCNLGRYVSGRRHLGKRDQLTVEWAGVYRLYHAAMMRTILTGKPTPVQAALHETAVEAHHASAAMLKPGKTFGDVYDAYAKVVSKARLKHLTATGYSLGTTFPPTWMDWPMFWHGNDEPIRAGMVLFVHTMVMSRNERLTQAPGQTYVITEKGPQCLSRMPLDLVANE